MVECCGVHQNDLRYEAGCDGDGPSALCSIIDPLYWSSRQNPAYFVWRISKDVDIYGAYLIIRRIMRSCACCIYAVCTVYPWRHNALASATAFVYLHNTLQLQVSTLIVYLATPQHHSSSGLQVLRVLPLSGAKCWLVSPTPHWQTSHRMCAVGTD